MEESRKADILIVDDKRSNLLAMEALLEAPDRNILKADSGNQALGLTLAHDFAVVLLDIQMPDMDGLETARLLRQNRRTRDIPIIFVTAINKERHQVFEGYSAGAVDYIFKPFEPIILKSKVSVMLALHRQKKNIELTNRQLRDTVRELELANRKILRQHKAAIEEERLKVILQLAGATANEMNQPLMNLLNHIELLETRPGNPDKQALTLSEIKASGQRIFEIAKKIQTVHFNDIPEPELRWADLAHRQPAAILCVGNNIPALDRLKQDKAFPMDCLHADTVSAALSLLETGKPDAVLMDYLLPDGTGLDVMAQMRAKDIDTPVIFVTDMGDDMIAARVIKEGAYDYHNRNALNRDTLLKTLASALEKEHLKKEVATAYNRLAVMCTRDSLTQLYNRRYFNEVMETEISRVRRYGSGMSVGMIDLDFFKRVNDKFGHLVGDKVLAETANIIVRLVRECDVVCRYGGEEFGLILPKTEPDEAVVLGERIRREIAGHPFRHGADTIGITVSIGIASYHPGTDQSQSMLVNQADNALYTAKANGRNRVEMYERQ